MKYLRSLELVLVGHDLNDCRQFEISHHVPGMCKLSKMLEERGLNYSSCILSFSFSQFFVMMMIE
jgi:hypothetical protein